VSSGKVEKTSNFHKINKQWFLQILLIISFHFNYFLKQNSMVEEEEVTFCETRKFLIFFIHFCILNVFWNFEKTFYVVTKQTREQNSFLISFARPKKLNLR
jgi:hypothetical protein